jgi:hypothetical protein
MTRNAKGRGNRGRPRSFRWIPDHDDPDSVDDLFAKNVDVRLEQMSSGHYWLCIFVGDEEHHFDIVSKRKIRAVARQPAQDQLAATRGG